MFSEELKKLRKGKNLTQQKLADALGISKSTISMYENGNRECPIELLVQLSNYYQVNLEYLLGLTDESAPLPPSKRLNLNID